MDRLEALVVKGEDFVREELATVLDGRLRFTQDGGLLLDAGFGQLSAVQKVACLLLACQAAHLLGLRDSAGATPSELVDLSGMAPGTIRPKLSALARQRLVVKQGKEYLVPLHAGATVGQLLEGGQ